jgi:hypothetical protein
MIGDVSNKVVEYEVFLQHQEKRRAKEAKKRKEKSTLKLNLDEPTVVLSPDKDFGEALQETLQAPAAKNQFFTLSLNKQANTPEEILEQAQQKLMRAQISYQCSLQTYYKFMLPIKPSLQVQSENLGNKSLSQFLEERCNEVLDKYHQVYNDYLAITEHLKQLPQNKLILLPSASL